MTLEEQLVQAEILVEHLKREINILRNDKRIIYEELQSEKALNKILMGQENRPDPGAHIPPGVMYWRIDLFSEGFGFKATIDNDGDSFSVVHPRASVTIQKISEWIDRQYKAPSLSMNTDLVD